MRSPSLKPADRKEAAYTAISLGNSCGLMVTPVAASIRWEQGPRRFTNRPAKFHSAVAVTLHFLGKFRVNDADDCANVLHFHQIIHIEADAENLFQAAAEGQMPHRIPARDVIGGGFHRHRLRIDVKGAVEGLPDFG